MLSIETKQPLVVLEVGKKYKNRLLLGSKDTPVKYFLLEIDESSTLMGKPNAKGDEFVGKFTLEDEFKAVNQRTHVPVLMSVVDVSMFKRLLAPLL